ncbi:WD40 repeat domain-containing protein [Kitasatospora sp. NPDC127111]|uniref:WD40 repeat domain-containing protein n=1 Tax=Kitasatospora sp. NPDC127111 TaxID=3345363 RepID=UPI00363880DD
MLVTVADDGRSRVLDLRNGRRLRTMRFPSSATRVAASTDGRVVITVDGSFSNRGVIRLSHVDVGMGEQTISDESVSCLALTPAGDLLLTGSDHEVRLWDVRTGDLLCDLEGGHTAPVFGVALSADGCHAVSADVDGTVQCWDVDWEYTRPPQ